MNKRRFQRSRKGGGWLGAEGPEDEGQRLLRIERQHPQYRRALERGVTVMEDGHEVNPMLHVQMHMVVENQILNREPPFVAEAAEALEAAGMDPHEVRHRLAEIVMHQVHAAMSGQAYNQDQHRAAVEKLVRSVSAL